MVSAALCLGTAYGLIAVGHPWWGWFVGIAGIAVVAAQVALPAGRPGARLTGAGPVRDPTVVS